MGFLIAVKYTQEWECRTARRAPADPSQAHPRPVQQVVRPQVHDGDRRVPRLRSGPGLPHVHEIGAGECSMIKQDLTRKFCFFDHFCSDLYGNGRNG